MNTMLTIEQMIAMQDDVVKWNKIFGIEVGDLTRCALYEKLSFEEMFDKNEFMQSYEEGDHEGVMDGLADLTFTVFMWALLVNERNRVTKHDYFLLTDKELAPVHEVVEKLKGYIKLGDSYGASTYLIQLLHLMSKDYDVLAAFDRVSESNFSKAIHESVYFNEQEELNAIESQGRYGDVSCEKSGEYFVFKAGRDLETGVEFGAAKKIIKSSKFVSVEDLGGLIEFKYLNPSDLIEE